MIPAYNKLINKSRLSNVLIQLSVKNEIPAISFS